jgi:hypothetical protein
MARCVAGLVARRPAHVQLAFACVALLVVTEIIFQILRNRIGGGLPFGTVSAKVAAPPVVVERDALAHDVILARLLARRVVSYDAGRRVYVNLALGHVAFLVLRVGRFGGSFEIFQFFRMRVGDISPFRTLSAEVAAKIIVTVERDALALRVIIARLLARGEVGGFFRRPCNPDLSLSHVALLAVEVVLGGRGSCERFQPLRMRLRGILPVGTVSAEVAAPPVIEERDTLAC